MTRECWAIKCLRRSSGGQHLMGFRVKTPFSNFCGVVWVPCLKVMLVFVFEVTRISDIGGRLKGVKKVKFKATCVQTAGV